MAGGTARWSDFLAMANAAEQIGLDSLWVPEHLLFRDEARGGTRGAWDSWSLISALAAVTSRVEIGPLVSCVSFRNPALIAKMADTIDEISNGRLVLGLGAGWHEPEYRAFGYPFDHRASRFEEAIQIIHTLLHEGQIDFEGRFYSARDCELRPRGPRPNGPPILIGTSGERMLRLTAKYADLWNTFMGQTGNRVDGVAPLREKVDAACNDVGRDPATLVRTVAAFVGFPNAMGTPGIDYPPHSCEPEELARTLRGYAGEGVSHVQLILDPFTVESIEALAPTLEILDKG